MSEFQALWTPTDQGFEPLETGAGPTDGFQALGPWVSSEPPPPEPESPAPEPDDGAEPPAPEEPEPAGDAEDEAPDDVGMLKLRQEAWEAGHAEGLESGRAAAAEQVAHVEDLVQQLRGARAEMFERSIQDLAAAVMHVSRAIVGRELAVDSSGVEGLVRGILTDLVGQDEVTVRLAPEDARVLREAWPSLMEAVGGGGEVHLEIDESLQPGGTIVEAQGGTVDASVEARFEAYAEGVSEWATYEIEASDD